MAFDSAADFVAANPNWATTMVIAGNTGTQDAPIIALVGPTTPAGTKGWVYSRGQPPWFIPIPPGPAITSLVPNTIAAAAPAPWNVKIFGTFVMGKNYSIVVAGSTDWFGAPVSATEIDAVFARRAAGTYQVLVRDSANVASNSLPFVVT